MRSSAPTSFPKRKLGVTPARSFDGPPQHAGIGADCERVGEGVGYSERPNRRKCRAFHLRVDEPGADIDTLCVGPKYVNREDFFTILCGILAQMEEVSELQPLPDAHFPAMKFKLHGISINLLYANVSLAVVPSDFFTILCGILAQMEEVSELQPLPDAHFPAMKFKLHGISINLLYANVSLAVVPSDLDISQNSVLYGVDEVNLLSLSECRVADQILDLVPNIEAPGYLREVDCAVMVARICQAYPNAAPSTLVTMFFSIFGEWYWPNPVMLCSIHEDWELGFPVGMHASTVKTGRINSTVHVSATTLGVMKEQFQIGNEVCQEIEMKQADWADLFEPLEILDLPVMSFGYRDVQLMLVELNFDDLLKRVAL
uniref:polynucleotide adenylyltransferase n=1 Tax=Aegilops tauschii TaxID=37682 RepID=M8BP45_AEGTA